MNTLLATLCSRLDLKPEHTELLIERDTSDVWRQFAIWSLVDKDLGVIRFTNPGSLQYKAIVQVAQLYIEDCKDVKRWKEAAYAATHAAEAAADAADPAADAAWSAYYAAWCAKADAADAYIDAITNAAAEAAADASADDTFDWQASEAAAESAWDAEAAAYYDRMADKLIELINAAPLKETP